MAALQGRCPQCRRASDLSQENPWRPFCSERCKLIDFGDWVSGRFSIPVEPDDAASDEPPPRDQSRQ